MKSTTKLSALCSASLLLMVMSLTESCSKNTLHVSRQPFGILGDTTQIYLYTLSNANGITLKATNYGGIITSLMVPDRNGHKVDIVLGYDSLSDYQKSSPYFGAIIGRYGNRISKGRFTLDGKEYYLPLNNGPNHLHGGLKGFDKVVWESSEFRNDSAAGVAFHYLSKDGEQGYPGNLDVTVTYSLTNHNELIFSYLATADKATPVNLTQHTYFNLAGEGDIRNHELMIRASKYTVVDSLLIPTGELRNVEGTPFDFRVMKPIGRDLSATGGNPVGYDHNFVLDEYGSNEAVIRVTDPDSGRTMEIFTDQPGVQFYSGNFLDGSITGKNGKVYRQYNGFCLETQHFPDSPNQPDFPNTILRPGETYSTTTIYRFSW